MITRETIRLARQGDEKALEAVLAESRRQAKQRDREFRRTWRGLTPEQREKALDAMVKRFKDAVREWSPMGTVNNTDKRQEGE